MEKITNNSLLSGDTYTQEDEQNIKKLFHEGLTDSEIAKKLGRNRQSISLKRLHLGLFRKKIRHPNKRLLTKEEQKELEVKRYKLSPRYKSLDGKLSPEEKELFNAEFEVYLEQLDEVDVRDIETIHTLVWEIIIQNRILDDEKKARDSNTPIDLRREYNDSVIRYERLMRLLKLSREQRLEGQRASKVCITDLVEALEKKENLDKIYKQEKIFKEDLKQFKLGLSQSASSHVYGVDLVEEKKTD
jgi:hypothetical protein